MRPRILYFLIFIAVFLIFSGCATVKPWQLVYLNDPEMQMGRTTGGTFEDYVQAIRTGSVVAGSKKASGGCGCN